MNDRSIAIIRSGMAQIKRFFLYFLAAGAICTFSACLIVDEKLVINKDGSGFIILECQSDIPRDELAWLVKSSPFLDRYPPLDENLLREMFPGEDFSLEMEEIPQLKLARGIRAKVRFTHIDALVNSPYARAKSLEISKNDKMMQIRSQTGTEALALFAAEGKLETNDQISFIGNALLKNKDLFYSKFTVSLPEADNGDGSLGIHGEKILDLSAQGKTKFQEETFKPLVLSCSAQAVDFSPGQSVRLNLDSFENLQEKTLPGTNPAPSADRLKSLVEFVPDVLEMERSFLFSGDYYSPVNSAKLSGNLVVSYTPAPVLASDNARTVKVVDDLGNILPPGDSRHSSYDQGDTKKEEPGHFPITLCFQPPEWGVKKIKSVAGEADFKFVDGLKIVKASQIITEDHIKKAENLEETRSYGFGREQDVIFDDKGLIVQIGEAEQAGGILHLNLFVSGDPTEIKEIQIFNNKGKAWPKVSVRERGFFSSDGRKKFDIFLPGAPERPLSLALLTSAGAKKVTVPFTVYDISCLSPIKSNADME